MLWNGRRFWARVLVALCASAQGLLAGCGGGGAGAAGAVAPQSVNASAATAGASNAPAVAALEVLRSALTVNSKGTDPVTLTVVAKNAQNAVLADQPIVVASTDAGVRLSPAGARTDANGQAAFTLQTSSPVNRSVPVVVQSGALKANTTVDVVGTTLSLNGPSAVVQGGRVTYMLVVRDSAGQAIAGMPVAVRSERGNPIEPGSVRTDANGQAAFAVVAAAGQSDTLSVSAAGVAASAVLHVSLTNLIVGAAANPAAEIEVNRDAAVSILLQRNGVPVSGEQVQLTATRGTLGNSTVTVVNGVAGTTVRSASAGPATIQATAAGDTTDAARVAGTVRVEFVSRTPAKIALQASPNVVGVNSPGTLQPQTSQLIAVVRDASDNPVKGAVVNFNALDPSNGNLSPPSATTDGSGVASAVFTPGATATGTNEIRITATIPGTGHADSVSLTGSRRELSVSFGTGNQVIKVDDLFNEVPYGVLVTDSAGNPVPNVRVQAMLVPTPAPGFAFRKGEWVFDKAENRWRVPVLLDCRNEDLNRNLLLDATEDLNANGRLDPRPSDAGTVYAEGSGLTDDKGTVRLRVRYLRDRGRWVQARLSVTATVVAGTEGFGYTDFVLPVLESDLTNSQVAPPGEHSPFGTDLSSCITSN